MDILQIRKKRMADLVHAEAEATRQPSAHEQPMLPSTTRGLLGAPPSLSTAVDGGAGILASTNGEGPPRDESSTAPTRSSVDDVRRETARDQSATVSGDPLEGFLARHDVIDGEGYTPFVTASPVEAPRFLTFDLGPESYAANIVDIREIIKMSQVTPVPRAPPGVLGVISKRGIVMPVVDLAAALRLRPVRRDLLPDQRVLVTGDGDAVVGLRVDRVHGVAPLGPDDLGPLPSGLSTSSVAFFRGLARRPEGMFVVIDLAAFREHLTAAAREGTLA